MVECAESVVCVVEGGTTVDVDGTPRATLLLLRGSGARP